MGTLFQYFFGDRIMVSDKLMKEFLDKMSTEPEGLFDLAYRLKQHEANAKRVLVAMQDLGLVVQVPIHVEGRKYKYGWAKTGLILKNGTDD